MRLEQIASVLERAVLKGAAAVLATRRGGGLGAVYKDPTELVTEADRRSDAAILEVFENELLPLAPGVRLHLEESGASGEDLGLVAGADPLDGTNHFACGGQWYSIQAHYAEHGVPMVGVIAQPEAYLPLAETPSAVGRIVSAIRGQGAFHSRLHYQPDCGDFALAPRRPLRKPTHPSTRTFVACIALSTKMTAADRERALRFCSSGLLSVITGAGNAAGNILLTIFGGQQVYLNFGSAEDLDLIPGQVIAEEAGMVVWNLEGQSPRWSGIRKQPFLVAADETVAARFLAAAQAS